MNSYERAKKAAARFFLRVGQARGAWRDENTLPLFPLLLVIDDGMLDADAKFEAREAARP